jgi:hypothetical protein
MTFNRVHRAALLVSAVLLMSACSGSSSDASSAEPKPTAVQPAPAPTPAPAPAPAPVQPVPAPPPPAPPPEESPVTPPPESPALPPEEPPPEPVRQPSVSLMAADSIVPTGSLAVLNWSSSYADTCTASGGWTGAKATSGTESVGPLSGRTTFSINCSGAGGNAMTMISVSVSATVTLNWQPPTENVDGTPLTSLAGYRIYYGTESRSYTEVVAVASPAATSYSVVLPSGTYYFAMTAIDAAGNESSYSNEVVKIVN